jgi:hypothetical protein
MSCVNALWQRAQSVFDFMASGEGQRILDDGDV